MKDIRNGINKEAKDKDPNKLTMMHEDHVCVHKCNMECHKANQTTIDKVFKVIEDDYKISYNDKSNDTPPKVPWPDLFPIMIEKIVSNLQYYKQQALN